MSEWSRRFSWGASGTVDLATEEGRCFLQERLSIFGQVGFLIDSGFFLLANPALFAAIPGLVLRGESQGALLFRAIDVAKLGLFLVTWLACRRGRRPPWLLRPLDAGAVFGFCSLVALTAAEAPPAYTGVRWSALLIVTNVLMTRAVMVPSTPRRTFRIGVVCSLPTLLATRRLTIVAPLVDAP